ncbi:hypothetical protein [Sphingobacterium sp. HMA12]|uniref:hypothetical protein n=1 Tax=Sphingobacterium sp. HMA12 TaxID=2050894 RepID=UPI0013150A59|nr:hypothetical protein [Sphingobacterium sp. HMA12]
MKNLLAIKAKLRRMLLPIPPDCEEIAAINLLEYLSHQGIEADTIGEFLDVKYEAWRLDQTLDPTFKSAVAYLLNISLKQIPKLGDHYFTLHSLILNKPFSSFEFATILLSHLNIILSLAIEQKMSAAKITRVLKSIDIRLDLVSWKSIRDLLGKIGIAPILNPNYVEQVFEKDSDYQDLYFADSSIEDAAEQVGEIARTLQFNLDLTNILKRLVAPESSHLPYLQILHYQTLIAEFYDHSFITLYEFNPRGNVALWLFEKWNNLVHTGNPILNNAKAVDIIDDNWVSSRKPKEYEQAANLVSVLKGLEGMGFAAAQELSGWIRRWLVRYIKINTIEPELIPIELSRSQIFKIIDFIAQSPTNTYGILEQRFVDLFASNHLLKSAGWRGRGIGDAVNSNNVSRKKLGDCDFQNSNLLQITAYEAHGGILTKIYAEGHLRTLKHALIKRREELESIADLDKWTLKLNFIAYDFRGELLKNLNIEGLKVDIFYVKMSSIKDQMLLFEFKEFQRVFDNIFIKELNDRRTPAFIRNKINSLLKV